jgi:hypothetical protein
MKVNLFNHWFKHKVPIDNHIEEIQDAWYYDRERRYSSFWGWLDDKFDVGQYYNWKEGRNYLCFNDEQHYIVFLLKL